MAPLDAEFVEARKPHLCTFLLTASVASLLQDFQHCETPGQLQGSKTPNPEPPRKNLKKNSPQAPTTNSFKKTSKK